MVDLEDKFNEKQSILNEISQTEDWLEEIQEELDDPDLQDYQREALLLEEQDYLDELDELENKLRSL